MSWFKPKDLLDRTYEVGILLKGIDGVFELLGALFLALINPQTVDRVMRFITRPELAKDPNDLIATHILRYSQELAHGHNGFAIAFLFSHGIVKVILVISLLRNQLWAYPFGIITLTLFTLYQLYLLASHATLGMILLTILDIFIIWLIWREWQRQRQKA